MSERQKTISKVPVSAEESFTNALMTAKKKAATSIQNDCSMGTEKILGYTDTERRVEF